MMIRVMEGNQPRVANAYGIVIRPSPTRVLSV
jgi:hypothetical protein